MDPFFRTDAPLGTWWQLRTFDLHERISGGTSWWNDCIDRRPAGIALLQYTLAGEMQYRDSSGIHAVPPGFAALSLTGDDVSYGRRVVSPEFFESFWISFSGAGLAEHWNDIRSRFGNVVRLGERCPAIERAKSICRMKRPSTTLETAIRSSDIHAFVRHLYAFLENTSRRGLSRVELAVDEIVNCTDGSVSLKEVAARYKVSREHLSRAFVQKHRMPPARFLARAKLRRAASMLLETKASVTAVACECGFGTKQALIRWMRSELKCLPSEYRRKNAP